VCLNLPYVFPATGRSSPIYTQEETTITDFQKKTTKNNWRGNADLQMTILAVADACATPAARNGMFVFSDAPCLGLVG